MFVVSYALFEQIVAHPDRARSLVLESGQNAPGVGKGSGIKK